MSDALCNNLLICSKGEKRHIARMVALPKPETQLTLEPDRAKILEAILYLIGKGVGDKRPLTQYDIVKSLFIADTQHLETYGRPVTFDNYVAMKFGPVPSCAYDMLKPDSADVAALGGPFWSRDPASPTAYRYIAPAREANLRKLSATDRAALDEALLLVRSLGFGGVVDYTHRNAEYLRAWDARGDAKSSPMEFERIVEGFDRELVEDLAFASRHR